MRREVPISCRQGAPMAGAIFMSNSETREQCFQNGVFGLPLEYEPFVNNVKQGMPLFLFDYTDRRLFGVFEAASDGGLNVNRAVFRSGYYPAQVCFNIVWKCRPLREDEFSHAIEENYYVSRKFYFDLSYQQVVRLYELFDKKRIEHPICKYSTRANLEREHSSKGKPDKRSLTPDISPFSADQLHTLIPSSTPKVSTVQTNYSASTSMHPIASPIFETAPSVSMPLVIEPSGVQFTPIASSHHEQIKLPYHSNEHLRDALTVNDISTQVSATCSQITRYHPDQFVANQPYPYISLSSGCMTRGPADGVRLSAKQSCAGYSLSISQVPTGGDSNYLCSTPYVPSYPQGNANWKDDYDIHCNQCKEIYASEHQHLNKGRSLAPPKLIQHGIPACPEVPEVSAIGQQKESFTDYIAIPDFAEDLENGRWKHGFNCNDSGSSGHGNDIGAYMSDRPYACHDIGTESNTTVPDQRPQNNVFSRLSLKQQPPSQEITGPSLNQLLHSLSQRTKLWVSKSSALRDDDGKGEQVMDRPCPPTELNLPSELEVEECIELPFLNFKRRSKATKLEANLGKEISGKVKRRKLVRPSFGDDNNALCSGKEHQGNGVKDNKHCRVESGGNKFNIDLNEPASVDSDLVEEDRSIVLCPAVAIKIQSEKPCDENTKEPNRSNAMEVLNKQAPSLDNSDTISLDLNVADLNTMDESKLQAILGSSLLQALDKLRNGRSNNSEDARSSINGKDSEVKMEMNSSGSTKRRCN